MVSVRNFLHVWQSRSLVVPKMGMVKAGTITSGGKASVIIYLRRKEKISFCTVVIAAREEWGENM